MDLDVAQVRAFVAAADHATLTRAAAELYLSQQALSKRLARLEATVGTLFDRRPTGLELTARGRRFLPVARELLATADLALATARDDPPAPLRVDVWGHLHPIHALVQAFAADHPEAVVELSMRRNLPQALTALARREIDVATGNLANLGEPLQAGLAAELITGTRLAALVNERNELAAHDSVRAQDLRRRRLWWPVQASSPELSAFADEYARFIDTPLHTEGRNMGLQAVLDVVRADAGILTLIGTDWPIPADAGVRVIPVNPAPYFPWYLIWAHKAAHPHVPALLESLRRAGWVPRPGDPIWLPKGTRPAARAARATGHDTA